MIQSDTNEDNSVVAAGSTNVLIKQAAKKGDWVDIGAPKKKGRFQPCGRKSAKKSKRAYPKCVPRSKARSMTAAQRRSAVARKRRAGNPGGKPTNVRTMVKRKKRRGTKKKK